MPRPSQVIRSVRAGDDGVLEGEIVGPEKSVKRRILRWLLGCALTLAGLGFGAWAALRVPGIYLRVALRVIQSQAYCRDRVDWVHVRAKCLELARGARSTKDTYPAIRYALRALGDRHSLLMPPLSTSAQRARSMANRSPSA